MGPPRRGAGKSALPSPAHPPPFLLVPVPSSRRAVAARGHDATRRLALAAAADLRRDGLTVRVAAVLWQRRAVADQSGLGARDRPANLSGALTAVRGADRLLRTAPVVLVDDLMTTGASLAAAARAVEEAGGRVLAAAVIGGPAPLRHPAGGRSGPGGGRNTPDGRRGRAPGTPPRPGEPGKGRPAPRPRTGARTGSGIRRSGAISQVAQRAFHPKGGIALLGVPTPGPRVYVRW